MGSDNENGPKRCIKTRHLGHKYVFLILFRVIHILTIFLYIFRHKKGWGAQQQRKQSQTTNYVRLGPVATSRKAQTTPDTLFGP